MSNYTGLGRLMVCEDHLHPQGVSHYECVTQTSGSRQSASHVLREVSVTSKIFKGSAEVCVHHWIWFRHGWRLLETHVRLSLPQET